MAQTISLVQINHTINDGGDGIQAGDTITFDFQISGDPFDDLTNVGVDTGRAQAPISESGPTTIAGGAGPITQSQTYTIQAGDISLKHFNLPSVYAFGEVCTEGCISVQSPSQSYPVPLELPASVSIDLFFDDEYPNNVGFSWTCTDADPSSGNTSGAEGDTIGFDLTRAGDTNNCTVTVPSPPPGYQFFTDNCTNHPVAGGDSATCFYDFYYEGVEANIFNEANAAEPNQDGAFEVRLDGDPPYPGMYVEFNISGTATGGEDYTAISPTQVYFAAPNRSALISVNVLNDEEYEGTETVVATLQSPVCGGSNYGDTSRPARAGAGGGEGCGGYTIGSAGEATVNIEDDDDDAQFVVTPLFDDNNPATVTIDMTCTDATPSSASLPASSSSPAVFDLSNVGVENECSAIQSSGPSGYTVSYSNCTNAFVGPTDTTNCTVYNDFEAVDASVTKVSDAAEPDQDGSFRIDVSSSPPWGGMYMSFEMSGTATEGDDYDLIVDILIPHGTTSVTVPIAVVDDLEMEDTETVIFTLLQPPGGNCGVPSEGSGAGGGSIGPCETYDLGENFSDTLEIVDNDGEATFIVDVFFDDGNPVAVSADITCSASNPSSDSKSASLGNPAQFDLMNVGLDNVCSAVQSGGPDGYTVSYSGCTDVAVPPGETVTCFVDNYYEAVTANLEGAVTLSEPDQDGSFRIALSGSPPYGGMTIEYDVGGTATEGEDYEPIGNIFIPFGSTSQTVPIQVIDDFITEPQETIEIDILPPGGVGGGAGSCPSSSNTDRSARTAIGGGEGSSCETYEPGSSSSIVVNVEDDDDNATFVVTKWFEDANPVAVDITLTCSNASPASSTKSATHNVPVEFNLSNIGTGNVCTATESGGPDGYEVATLNCTSVSLPAGAEEYCYIDNIFIPVTAEIAAQSNAAEPDQNGGFQVTLSGSPPFGGMNVNFTVSGSATPDDDYQSLGTSIFIPFGTTTQDIPVEVIDDNEQELIEDVIVVLAPAGDGSCDSLSVEASAGKRKSGTEDVCEGYSVGGNSQAVVQLTDDDRPLVAIEVEEDASEPETDGNFRVFLAKGAPQGGIVVQLVPSGSATSGEDYDTLPRELVFAEGEITKDVVLSPIDDNEIEGTEQVDLFIRPSDDFDIVPGSSPATMNILDDDVEMDDLTVSIAATNSTSEPSGTGVFTVTLSRAPEADTSVVFTLEGTATPGTDYTEPASPLVIPAGSTTGTIDIIVIDDSEVEETETVSVTLVTDDSLPVVGDPTATIEIADDDESQQRLSVAATSSTAEPSGTGVFTVSLAEASESDISVNFTLGGTATAGTDYTEPSSPVVIAAGSTSAPINIEVIDDTEVEGTETVTVTVSSGDIPVEGDGSATINIEDDDTLEPANILVDPIEGLVTTEDGGTATFNVVLSREPTADVTVDLASSDTTEGTVSPASLTFTAANWNVPQTVTVTGVDDDEVDGDIAYTVDTSPATSSDSDYSGLNPADVSVTNQDNDVEPAGGAEFTATTYTVNETDGSASIGIRRTGSTTNALTVTFMTDDENPSNTADAGDDYTSTSTEVSWAAGETDEKSVSVEVFENEDKDDSATEQVALKLTGTTIEEQSATLEILSEPSGPPIPENPARPPNAQEVVDVINESCPQFNNDPDFQALCTAMVVTDSSLTNPLSETTPDDAAVVRSSGMQTANIQVTAVDGRIGTLRGGGGAGFTASGFSVGIGEMTLNAGLVESFISSFHQNSPDFMQANANDDDDFVDNFGRWGAWISGRVIMGEKDRTTNQIDYDFDTAGLTFGMDYRFRDNLVAGVAVGYANTDSELGAKEGTIDTRGWSVSVYGTWFHEDKFYLGGSLGYGGNDYDHTRRVRYTIDRPAPGNPVLDALPDWAFDVDQSFQAKYDGSQVSAAISGGWDFSKNGWTYGPTFRLDWVKVKVDGYDETLVSSNIDNFGEFGWGVHIDDQSYSSLQPAVGFSFTKTISRSWGIFIPQGYIDYVAELQDDGIVVTGRFLGDTNQVPFALQTDDFTESFIRAGLGFGVVLKNNKSGFFMVDGDLGRDLLKTYYINAGFRWQF